MVPFLSSAATVPARQQTKELKCRLADQRGFGLVNPSKPL
jgi:hypothetical protein